MFKKKASYILVILITWLLSGYSQSNHKIDSLKLLIQKSHLDSNKVNLIYQLGGQYEYFNSKERIEYYIVALDLAKDINYLNGIKKISNTLIVNLYHRQMFDVSFYYCLEYLDYLEKNELHDELFKLYKVYGNLLGKQGKFNDALKYLRLAKNFQLEKNDEMEYANVLNNISILFLENNRLDSAMVYCLKAVELYRKNNNRSAWANSVLGISEIYIKRDELISAKKIAFEALTLYSNYPKDKHGIANSLFVIGQINLKNSFADSALIYFNNGLLMADTLNFIHLKRDYCKSISESYEQLGNHKEAYRYRVLFEAYNDSISVENTEGKMLEMEVKYDINKKETALKVQKREIEASNTQKNYLIMGIICVLLLLTISVRGYNQKKKSNMIITQQKTLVEHKQKEIVDSLNYAKRIQKGIMPNENEFAKIFENSFILYKPKDIVSGDFYWFVQIVDKSKNINIVAFAAADCTGHGVPGAFMSMLNSTLLNQCIVNPDIKTPSDALNYINRELPKNLKSTDGESSIRDGMDIALCIIDLNTSELLFSGANNPCWVIRNNILIELKATKQAITASDEMTKKTFISESFTLQKNDSVYIFTDGYTDQFGGPKGKKFKHKQFSELLLSVQTDEMEIQKNKLNDIFKNWKGDLEQVDDVLIVGIRL